MPQCQSFQRCGYCSSLGKQGVVDVTDAGSLGSDCAGDSEAVAHPCHPAEGIAPDNAWKKFDLARFGFKNSIRLEVQKLKNDSQRRI